MAKELYRPFGSGYLTRIILCIIAVILSATLFFSAISLQPEPLIAGVIVSLLLIGVLVYSRVVDKEWP